MMTCLYLPINVLDTALILSNKVGMSTYKSWRWTNSATHTNIFPITDGIHAEARSLDSPWINVFQENPFYCPLNKKYHPRNPRTVKNPLKPQASNRCCRNPSTTQSTSQGTSVAPHSPGGSRCIGSCWLWVSAASSHPKGSKPYLKNT